MPAPHQNRLDYIRDLFAPESALLRQIRASLTDPNDQISVYPEEGKLLQLLIRLSGAKKIIEIGTLGGYASAWMAAVLPESGHLWTIEKDDRRFERARANLSPLTARGKITLCHGNALQILPTLEKEGPFDLVFIDADKLHYTHYLDWAETHVRKGGLIIADNTFLFDAVWQETLPPRVRPTARDAMRAFNLRLADPEKYTAVLLPTVEGMTIAIKEF